MKCPFYLEHIANLVADIVSGYGTYAPWASYLLMQTQPTLKPDPSIQSIYFEYCVEILSHLSYEGSYGW